MALTDRYVTADAAGGGDGSVGTPWTWAEMLTGANAGDMVNVEYGTYAQTTTTNSFTNAGTPASPIFVRGFYLTPGDLDPGGAYWTPRNAITNLLDTSKFPTITYTAGEFKPNKSYVNCFNLDITSQRTSVAVTLIDYTSMFRCRIAVSGTGGASSGALLLNGVGVRIIDCDLHNTCTTALYAVSPGQYCYLSKLMMECTNGAAIRSNQHIQLSRGIIFNTATGFVGFGTGGIPAFSDVDFYNVTAIYSGHNGAILYAPVFDNCHYTDCGSGFISGYAATAELALLRYNCRRRDITTLEDGYDNWPEIGSLTTDGGDASTDYINAAGGDFRLIPTAPGRLRGAWPLSNIGALNSPDVSKPRPQIIGA